MSAEVASQMLQLGELSAEEKLVLLLIADNTNAEGCGGFRVTNLARMSGLPTATIERLVGSFVAAGFLTVDGTEPDGGCWISFNQQALGELPTGDRRQRRLPLEATCKGGAP